MTSIPSTTFVMQAAASLFEPAISTMHRRQAPRSRDPLEVAQGRDVDPVLDRHVQDRRALGPGDVLAVDLQGVDGGHAITSAGLDRADAGGTDLVDDVGHVLVPEVAQRAEDRVGRTLAEAAERGLLDDAGQPLERGQVVRRRDAARDQVEEHPHLGRADAAGGALAARLVAAEVLEVPGDVHHARGVVHDDQAAGAHERADLDERLVADRHVEVLGRDAAAGRARRSGPP